MTAEHSRSRALTRPCDGVTFYEDVAPIVYANCVGCHRAGGIAPFPLLTSYEEALRVGALMAIEMVCRIELSV